jgi:hypothetical protein
MGVVVVIRASLAGPLTESTVMCIKVGADVTLSGRPVVGGSGRHEQGKGSGWGQKRERERCASEKNIFASFIDTGSKML